jgi:acetoin utilization deacetylase AcuC-like enzyme
VPWIVRDARFRAHRGAPGHPECPERLAPLEAWLDAHPEAAEPLALREATDPELLAVHSRPYVEQLASLRGGSTWLDPDTYVAPRSVEIARLACGGAIELAKRVAAGHGRAGLALLRPPGHHAERAAGMGFCLINQIAVAAEALRFGMGVERIAIVDWDVHHGNGTQHHFEASRDTLFVSLHRYPFYPGTGTLAERGAEAGLGSTVNLPMPAGAGDAEYLHAFADVVVPVLREFRPEMLLVSAGFDAHVRDPLGGMRVTTGAFATMAAQLLEVARDTCEGRIALLLEGGYDPEALSECVREVLAVLSGDRVVSALHTPPTSESSRRLVRIYGEAHGTRFASVRRLPPR